ncbi:hypothetical protein RF11_13863 [Thelohanellus kitauei]|uniref:Uncharacterized protein n=1 Tax=Thelohanellus kitauei TaxID=669202 RepID=A0A0C2N021_THEKT|nr:hypothetical protein RF11_13863 [Thelohanellus kitauei]
MKEDEEVAEQRRKMQQIYKSCKEATSFIQLNSIEIHFKVKKTLAKLIILYGIFTILILVNTFNTFIDILKKTRCDRLIAKPGSPLALASQTKQQAPPRILNTHLPSGYLDTFLDSSEVLGCPHWSLLLLRHRSTAAVKPQVFDLELKQLWIKGSLGWQFSTVPTDAGIRDRNRDSGSLN